MQSLFEADAANPETHALVGASPIGLHSLVVWSWGERHGHERLDANYASIAGCVPPDRLTIGIGIGGDISPRKIPEK